MTYGFCVLFSTFPILTQKPLQRFFLKQRMTKIEQKGQRCRLILNCVVSYSSGQIYNNKCVFLRTSSRRHGHACLQQLHSTDQRSRTCVQRKQCLSARRQDLFCPPSQSSGTQCRSMTCAMKYLVHLWLLLLEKFTAREINHRVRGERCYPC